MAKPTSPIIVSVLSLVFCTYAWAGPAPEPSASPLPQLDPHAHHVLLEKCREVIKAWATVQSRAQTDLAACSLHRFNEDCQRLAQERGKLVAKDSPCMQIPDAVDKISKLPELNCNIVKVPETCSTR